MNPRLWSSLDWLKRRSSLAAAISLKHRGALRDEGWFRSVQEQAPVNAAGEPIPWISYPALHFIAAHTRPEMQVFEFGSGYSTLWWASRVRKVVSCEADEKWCAQVQKRAPANVELLRVDEKDYPETAVRWPDTFDVVVIDGGDRVACTKSAVSALNAGGVILWDDAERTEYQPGFAFLRERAFARIDFVGLGPIVNITKATSIFYRPGNIFGI